MVTVRCSSHRESAEAGVSEKFVDAVVGICEDEMIGDVTGLQMAQSIGMLPKMFKPVVALGIERAFDANNIVPVPADALLTPAGRTGGGADVVDVPSHLEFEPYHDISKNLPLNTYKNKAPHTASLVCDHVSKVELSPSDGWLRALTAGCAL